MLLGNNITFGWKVELFIIILCDDRMKENMEIINGKYGGNDFTMNSMGKLSNIFSISCDNKNPEKGYVRTNINFQQKMLMKMIDTSDILKERHIIHIH